MKRSFKELSPFDSNIDMITQHQTYNSNPNGFVFDINSPINQQQHLHTHNPTETTTTSLNTNTTTPEPKYPFHLLFLISEAESPYNDSKPNLISPRSKSIPTTPTKQTIFFKFADNMFDTYKFMDSNDNDIDIYETPIFPEPPHLFPSHLFTSTSSTKSQTPTITIEGGDIDIEPMLFPMELVVNDEEENEDKGAMTFPFQLLSSESMESDISCINNISSQNNEISYFDKIHDIRPQHHMINNDSDSSLHSTDLYFDLTH